MARAAGCKTYKLKFGNRGHNQPVKDMLTDVVHTYMCVCVRVRVSHAHGQGAYMHIHYVHTIYIH